MMGRTLVKAKLVPVYLAQRDAEFDRQVTMLRHLLADQAELLPAAALGAPLPEADAVILPQLLGAAYSRVDELRHIGLPLVVMTSEFGTMSMWDWEIVSYLRAEGIELIAPFSLQQAQVTCRTLALKRDLRRTTFLVYQDNPGEGHQASIFKRFYWWEDECSQRIRSQFGLRIVRKSFRELGASAAHIPEEEAQSACDRHPIAAEGVSPSALRAAFKLYLAVQRDIAQDDSIRAVGINCLNESRFSDTTPCLAANLLYEERGLTWGCEADTVSMVSQYILHVSLAAPAMMSNLYPFLMGQVALKHERIPVFPDVADPENHILIAHCGYFGLMPASFATDWVLKPKVLAIVGENAAVVDARLATGEITLAKLGPTLGEIVAVEGKLEGYVQYPGSDCLNGGVVSVPDGCKLVQRLPSHHCIIVPGHRLGEIELIAKVFGLRVEAI